MSKKYTGLIKALTNLEEKLGCTWLEAPATLRNRNTELMEPVMQEIMKALGGDNIVLYSSKKDEEGRSTFVGAEKCEPNDILNVYESMQEKLLAAFDPQVYAALGAAASVAKPAMSGKTGPRELRMLAEAMGEALNDLPPEMIKKVDENMNNALRRKGLGGMPKRKSEEDEDPLADLM